MKFTPIQTVFTLTLVSMFVVLMTACHQNSTVVEPKQAEPQVVVVTATPLPALAGEQPEAAKLPAAPETDAAPTETAVNEPAAALTLPVQAGMLLQAGDGDIFYLTEARTRQRFYDLDTFQAFGFAKQDIVPVGAEVLETIPFAGELTRLGQDSQNHLYWAAQGRLWSVEDWQEIVNRQDYTGLPVTHLDQSLQRRLLPATPFENGTLLRHEENVYYLLDHAIYPLTTTGYEEVNLIDLPAEMLAAYRQTAQLEAVSVNLNDATQAANLRSGPGLAYDIVTVINKDEGPFSVQSRTEAGDWLLVRYQDSQAWLAADLVEDNVAISLLRPANLDEALASSLPEAQPAAVVEPGEPEPVYCDTLPIRGFGKVWGEHPEVQQTLFCPTQNLEQGTNAAVQMFQHGLMLWLEADSVYVDDPVYVFFEDGTYQRFGDLGPADPAKVGTTPDGFFEVGDRFSKVYWEGTGARVKERLGYAISAATDSPGAFQQFRNGRMFWAGTVDRIFVIYDYYDYDENGEYVRARTWASYEDTF
jgi:hypothetical protein